MDYGKHVFEAISSLMEAGSVAVRTRTGDDLGSLSIDEFAERLSGEVAARQ